MKIFLLLAMIVAFECAWVSGLLPAHGDWKASGNMTMKLTGKYAPTHYFYYGCHCGFKGRGSTKDATDWCCFEQQCCYLRLNKWRCVPRYLRYTADYKGNQIICVDKDVCKRQLCECDKKTAFCFKDNIRSYNKTYQFYKRSNCKGKEPQC